MRKKITIWLLLILSGVIACKKYEAIDIKYDVGDVVLIEPDSSRVRIVEWTAWEHEVKYTVDYLDTNRRNIILGTKIIGLVE